MLDQEFFTIRITESALRRPFAKNQYYIQVDRLYKTTDLFHIYMGFWDTPLGVFNMFFVTNARAGNLAEEKEVLQNLNAARTGF